MATGSKTNEKYKVLLLGETGSGKTRFVDLFSNYAELSKENDPTRENLQANLRDFTRDQISEDMISTTNKIGKYPCNFADYSIELIDTPGFADNRGADQQKINREKLIEHIKNEEDLNCFCLFFNGTISRLTDALQRTLTELIQLLPKEVLEHTIIVFTSVEKKRSVKNELIKLIETKLKFSNLKQVCLAIDNPFSYWVDCDGNLDEELIGSFKKCFDGMLKDFCSAVKSIGKINELSSVPTFVNLQHQIDFKIKDYIETKNTEENTIVARPEPTDKFNTICMVAQCFSNCHEPCFYGGNWIKAAKYCEVFKDSQYCKVCKHHYSDHKRLKYAYKEISSEADTVSSENGQEMVDVRLQTLQQDLLSLLANYQRKSNRSYIELLENKLTLSRLQQHPDKVITRKKKVIDEIKKILGTDRSPHEIDATSSINSD